jgi:antitoxin CcdA
MRNSPNAKKPVNVTVDVKLLQQARDSDINFSAVLETALRSEIARRWQADNATAIAAYNQRVENEGLWFDEFRTW